MRGLLPYLLLSLVDSGVAGVTKLQRRWSYQCPAGTCAFMLSVEGMPVYENPTDAHQLAYGGTMPGAPVEFCISPQGQITDDAGVCGITVPIPGDMETTQFQCDAGMSMLVLSWFMISLTIFSSASVFTISCTGELEYEGSPYFYACLASAAIGYNIYATPPALSQCASGQPLKIELMASACAPPCGSEWPDWSGRPNCN